MFISHLTADKMPASNLKIALSYYGVSCFVSHEDIEPTKEWANEIEKALSTMDGLCAIITPKFNNSLWCDQEVGFALGRKVLVIPICKDCDPYGIMGKYQGIQSKNESANILAKEIFKILCNNPLSQQIFATKLGKLFLNSRNTNEAIKWINLLNDIFTIDKGIIQLINNNYFDNENLNNTDIISHANKLFAKYSLNKISSKLFIEKNTEIDDLPF
jgi:hypothetical protein